eukprot:TRINITY_DN27262_c0_g2_i1.p1 TRINITY_DN27262_c0_g2~~TRINITY_DN27262_c0_g2_i1.p1  ORF type:complete len:530 (-),score=114.25 TRINITY_DN27262_c0_g2_i1:127-1581(-)
MRRRASDVLCWLLAFGLVGAIIDDAGNYRAGVDLMQFAPVPQEADGRAAADLAQQPPEKLFALLAYELSQEDNRPQRTSLSFGEFREVMQLNCVERLIYIMKLANDAAEELKSYHLNITSTTGLYWFLQKHGEDDSWLWLLATSHEKMTRRVNLYFSTIAVLALDRAPCLTPDFRTVLMDAVARWKKVFGDFTALLWNGVAFGVYGDVVSWRDVDNKTGLGVEGPGQDPPNTTWSENLIFGNIWASSLQQWFEMHAQVVSHAVGEEIPRAMAVAAQPGAEAAERRRHHQDDAGAFASFEYLRRQVFGQWALDKGLMRGMLRHVLKPLPDEDPVSLGDFGAGGGQYSTWLNDTGLVQAFAFDGTPHATQISGGAVQQLNLIEDVHLWRSFDWVMCLEVAEHVPKEHTAALLRNLRRHAKKGLVMSWSSDWEGIGHVNCLSWEDFISTVERETGLQLDRSATEAVRSGCSIDYIARTIAVFRVPAA